MTDTDIIPAGAASMPVDAQPGGWMDVAVQFKDNPAALREAFDIFVSEQQRLAAQAYNVAMVGVQGRTGPITNDAYNQQTKSKYAKLKRVDERLRPIYTAAGFAVSAGTLDSPREDYVRVYIDLMHTAGHVQRHHIDLRRDDIGIQGSRNKTEVHGTGSTFSYGRRYLIAAAFNIVFTDEDTDGNTPDDDEPVSAEQVANLEALITELGGREAFLRYARVERVEDIPAAKYAKAVQAIEARRGR